jgi:hypothetical protein
MNDIVQEVEELSRGSFGEIRDYFANAKAGDDSGMRVDRALKLVGVYSRIRATRANESAISVAVAKMMGLKGDALAPVFEKLTGINPVPHLPAPEPK